MDNTNLPFQSASDLPPTELDELWNFAQSQSQESSSSVALADSQSTTTSSPYPQAPGQGRSILHVDTTGHSAIPTDTPYFTPFYDMPSQIYSQPQGIGHLSEPSPHPGWNLSASSSQSSLGMPHGQDIAQRQADTGTYGHSNLSIYDFPPTTTYDPSARRSLGGSEDSPFAIPLLSQGREEEYDDDDMDVEDDERKGNPQAGPSSAAQSASSGRKQPANSRFIKTLIK